jgi:hypothetical protein
MTDNLTGDPRLVPSGELDLKCRLYGNHFGLANGKYWPVSAR